MNVKEAVEFESQVGDVHFTLVEEVMRIRDAHDLGVPSDEVRKRPAVYGSLWGDLKLLAMGAGKIALRLLNSW